jgi:hypothetical protein
MFRSGKYWIGQSSIIWSIVWQGWPQSQLVAFEKPHPCIINAHFPCEVLNRFSNTHSRRLRSNPGGSTVGSRTRSLWTGATTFLSNCRSRGKQENWVLITQLKILSGASLKKPPIRVNPMKLLWKSRNSTNF